MPRTYSSTTHWTQFDEIPAGTKFGDTTILTVIKRSTNSVTTRILTVEDSAGYVFTFGIDAANNPFIGNRSPASTSTASTMTVLASEGWVGYGVTKASGNVAPVFHKYLYSTGVRSSATGDTAMTDSSVVGVSPVINFARVLAVGPNSFFLGDIAVAAIYPRVLSNSEIDTAYQTLAAMAAANPTTGLWLLDGATGQSAQLFNAGSITTDTSVDSTQSAPIGYGHPILSEFGPPSASGGSGTATLTADGVLTSTGSGSITPPTPTPPVPIGTGWTLLSVSPANVSTEVKFTNTGQFTHDQSRPVRRAITGFTLLPSEAAKVDLARDSVHAYLRVDDQTYPMGIFYFTESSRAKDAIKDDDGNPADLIHVSLSDQFILMQRSDEVPRFALKGADPSQEMIRYLGEIDVPHSVTGAESPIAEDVVWQPFTTYEAIVSQLAELAGHRRPWADNYGVIRSVASRVVDSEVIPLEDLDPIDGTIVITDNYLSAPNRVVVYDDQGDYPIVGIWDAPSTAPNSAATRGWVQTAGVQAQGLSGTVHAQQVAQTIGEQMAARRLAGDIVPTNRLDGPVVLSYDGALWLVNGWSVSTAVGSTMSFDASELVIPPNKGH